MLKHEKATSPVPEYLPLGEAVEQITGMRMSDRTLRRWCSNGLTRPNGGVYRLRSRVVGRQRLTRLCWVEEFLESGDDTAQQEGVAETRTSELEKALARLRERGIQVPDAKVAQEGKRHHG